MLRINRTVFLGGLALLLGVVNLAVAPGRAAAEWQVKRAGDDALYAQAARTLAEQPDDQTLAVQLVRLSGKDRLPSLLKEFRQRAEASLPRYAAVEAYAQLLLASGNAAEAAVVFQRAAGLQPQLAAPVVGRAHALRASGRREEAAVAYQQALALEKRPRERQRLLAALIGQLTDPGDIERELAARRELLLLDNKDETAERLADALERAGRPDQAAEVLAQRLRSGGTEPLQLALRVAMLREAAGADKTAAQMLTALLRKVPPSAVDRRRELWKRAVDVARRRNQLQELSRELERDAGTVEWDVLSQVRDELGDLDGALGAARRAVARMPADVELRRRIVTLLERLGREDDVTAEYEELARMDPHQPRFAIELCERQFRRNKKLEAERQFDRALARFARNASALVRLAELASRWGQEQRAIAAWERLRRLSPRDEMAILGLGEAYFQRGKKETAVRTWQALRKTVASRADGHGRLAEVLMEHDLLPEATAEADVAQTLAPKQPRHHRTMAQILERQRKSDAAIKEWQTVLEMSKGAAQAGERQEARSRILALVSREGRARLDEWVRRLEGQLRQRPDDREAAMFLADAQLRNGNVSGAIATLRGVVDRDKAGTSSDGDAILALVRLLRQSRQLDDAVRWLEELARRVPARAREAHIQIADIELGRYDDQRALAHAERASSLAPADGQALVRIAEVEERAGEGKRALATYRRAFARDGNPTAAFALARLLERQGAAREASDVLRTLLRSSTDEEVINDAARRAMELEEYLGTLGDLERLIGSLNFSADKGAAYRHAFVDVLRRLVPTLYRTPDSPSTVAERARLAQHGLRPLLELLAANERDPDRGLIELGGFLGNPDAAPVLARFAQLPTPAPLEAGAVPGLRRLATPAVSESLIAAVIALGRLRDERARPALEQLIPAADGGLRAAAVWALGRIANPDSAPLLTKALEDPRSDVAAVACLGLGRLRDPRFTPTLAGIATDIARAPRLRRAAIIALGVSGDRGATPALLALLDAGDHELGRAAAAALGAIADPQMVFPLLTSVLVQRPSQTDRGLLALDALDHLLAASAIDDEAKSIDGNRLDVDLMLGAFFPGVTARPDRSALWIERVRGVEQILGDALGLSRGTRRHVLSLLNSRDDGLGLGPLCADGNGEISPATSHALRTIAESVRGRVAALLDDADPEIQGLALRLLAKLGDPRVTPARIAALAALAGQHPGPVTAAAAASAAAVQVRARAQAAGPIVQAVVPLFTDPAWQRRLAAVEVLRAVGAPGRPPLETALGDPNVVVRAAAAAALGRPEPLTHTGP
ncbi:MAG TPA: HEAT repeat domain-containing protein [Polyangia bacterium]|nr:HEAT repeat domain-containing protein [Polyangia bacterium]